MSDLYFKWGNAYYSADIDDVKVIPRTNYAYAEVILINDSQRIMPVPTEKYVERSCYLGEASLLAFLVYNMILVALCSYFAFKTRKLPDNFNESKFISMCAFTTFMIWLAFIPTYFTTATEKNKTILLALALILNDSVVLAFLFLPRIYGVLYVEDAHIQGTMISFAPQTTHGSSTMHSDRVAPEKSSEEQNKVF